MQVGDFQKVRQRCYIRLDAGKAMQFSQLITVYIIYCSLSFYENVLNSPKQIEANSTHAYTVSSNNIPIFRFQKNHSVFYKMILRLKKVHLEPRCKLNHQHTFSRRKIERDWAFNSIYGLPSPGNTEQKVSSCIAFHHLCLHTLVIQNGGLKGIII